MLVALAVTLVMMAAVVNLFANVSASIRNRRAVIELGGQLRQARQRLALDLAGATCPARTWQRPGEDRGYIEIIEGPWSDMNPSSLVDGVEDPPNGNLELDYATSLVPSGGDPAMDLTRTTPPMTKRQPVWPDPTDRRFTTDVTNGRGLGDFDDILALTVRSESEPFVAQIPNPINGNTETVESQLAEVLWFAGENPQDNPDTPDENEAVDGAGNRIEPGMRRIYRRVLIIAPHLGPWANHPGNVSCHWDGTRWVANTLGDLTKRENRVERRVNSGVVEPYPHPISGMGSSTDTNYLMLNDALAFDVRVYDAGAPLLNVNGSNGAVVQPGDPYWPKAAATITSQTTYNNTVAGFGAYVDLGWAYQPGTSNLYWPPGGQATVSAPLKMPTSLALPTTAAHFAVPHQAGWHPRNRVRLSGYPAVYDTWSYHYENNGLDEDNLDGDGNTGPGLLTGADEGTNGLDDPVPYDTALNQPSAPSSPIAAYGVDDAGERETSPPYDAPLRGVKISLRVYERDARQIREASVTHAFVP
jgi:hypothetical protein